MNRYVRDSRPELETAAGRCRFERSRRLNSSE